MAVKRYTNSSNTATNLQQLTTILQDPGCVEVRLFASRTSTDPSFNANSDGPETNPPLVAALATYRIPVYGAAQVLFDGLFMTGARSGRAREVQALLSVADAHPGKVLIGAARVPFTSALPPPQAAATLLKESAGQYNRAQFFQLLTGFTETSYPF